MIEITNTEVFGWEAALRGMRNPMNSWDRSDSCKCDSEECHRIELFGMESEPAKECNSHDCGFCIGENDLKLMMNLVKAGPVHSKFMRMIHVQFDVNAPLYWWKEMDTYKVATVRNSCSTMHKIHDKEFTFDDFSHEHLCYYPVKNYIPKSMLKLTIDALNECRDKYLETKDKLWWWQMIQLLPASYNQKATMDMSYETLRNIYRWRKDHKLDEWREFCEWIESLPYSELITMEGGSTSESE